ncbi:hypothetical protein C2U55_25100 [Enterobacteriaceae bacterium ENNIH3]|nr:hypothetical protein C2U55_25100 [Enterobacteriaceae bacterium ENNIH3]AUV07832.1 hypothetical protein C2U52_17005 [Enterobacteriaceae bacterium ENNIH2]
MLASIKADTSRIEEKIQGLFEMLPEHVPDHLLSIISSLSGEIILVNNTPAVITGGTFDVLYALDFSPTAYNEVMTAIRAFKTDFTHS